jgi:hypothetical protein
MSIVQLQLSFELPSGFDLIGGKADAMADTSGKSAPAPSTIEIKPTTTVEDILAALKRQGISDLQTFADKLIAHFRKKAEEEGDDDAPFEKEFLIHEHYFLTHAEQ